MTLYISSAPTTPVFRANKSRIIRLRPPKKLMRAQIEDLPHRIAAQKKSPVSHLTPRRKRGRKRKTNDVLYFFRASYACFARQFCNYRKTLCANAAHKNLCRKNRICRRFRAERKIFTQRSARRTRMFFRAPTCPSDSRNFAFVKFPTRFLNAAYPTLLITLKKTPLCVRNPRA